jgi:hypothetical protein
VEIPIAASGTAPPAAIYDAPDSGTGAIVIGNVGWWRNILASTQAGLYSSTITLTVSSGP